MHLQLTLGDDPTQTFECNEPDYYSPPITPAGGSRSFWCEFDAPASSPQAVDPDTARRLLGQGMVVLANSALTFPELGLELVDRAYDASGSIVMHDLPGQLKIDQQVRLAHEQIEAQSCRARHTCGAAAFRPNLIRNATLAWCIAALALIVLSIKARRSMAALVVFVILWTALALTGAPLMPGDSRIDNPTSLHAVYYLIAGALFASVGWRLPLSNTRALVTASATALIAIALGFVLFIALVVYALSHYAG